MQSTGSGVIFKSNFTPDFFANGSSRNERQGMSSGMTASSVKDLSFSK